MSTSATLAPTRWDLDRYTVLDVRGADRAARSAALDEIGAEMLAVGGTVRCIDPSGDRQARPAGNVSSVGTVSGALSTLFDALDIAAADPSVRHLVLVDHAERLLRAGGCSGNEFDATLAILLAECDRSGVRVAIAHAGDLHRHAPMTSFALREASRFDL